MRKCDALGCDNAVADEAYCAEHTPDITPEMMAEVEFKSKELYFTVENWKGETWKAHYIQDNKYGGGWRIFDERGRERTDEEAKKIINLVKDESGEFCNE